VPQRNCRHNLFCKDEQSLLPEAGAGPDDSTVYKVASYCTGCRWHVDVVVDFRNNGPTDRICGKGNTEHALHHFLAEGGDTNGINSLGSQNAPRTYSFGCSAQQCPVRVHIHMKPPHITDQDIETLTNQAQLRRRWEVAKQIAGDRADMSMARKVDGPDFLNTYLQDALNPVKGKIRIPLLNKKFLKTFGRDCDAILNKFGFTTDFEEENGETNQVWFLPRPAEDHDPLNPSLRDTIQDARYELDILIMSMPDNERTGARHKKLYSLPSRDYIERALACHDCM
jgi:ubiquitin carboxyl-terminal hydrolase 25/28